MELDRQIERVRAWPSVLLGILNLLVLGIIGGLSPLTRQALIDFGFESNWRVGALLPVHWAWTLPVGFLLIAGLIVSARAGRPSLHKAFTFGTGTVLCLAVIFAFFALGFAIRGETITGPFGIRH